MREQGVVLEHQTDAAPLRRHAAGIVGHDLSVDPDGAALKSFQAGGDAQQRGLAAAAGADQTQDLPLSDAQADVIDRRHARIAVPDMLKRQRFSRCRGPARPGAGGIQRGHGIDVNVPVAGPMAGWSRSNGRSSQQGRRTFPKGGAQSPGALGEAGFVEVGVIHRSRSLLVVGGHKRLLRHVASQFAIGS